MTGELPASGNLEEVEPKEHRGLEALLRDAPAMNAETLSRVAKERVVDAEVRMDFLRKAGEEARGAAPAGRRWFRARARVRRWRPGKGEWRSLARASNEAALTPRFPVDEGCRAKPEGGWKRKARRPSGRRARVRDGGLCAR